MLSTKDNQPEVAMHDEATSKEYDRTSSTENESRMPLWKAIKTHPRITAYSFSLTLGILLWGYDLVIVGTVSSIPAFQEVFGQPYEDRWIIPASWLALWQIATNIGLMAGSLAVGWLQDRIGRRTSLIITSLIASASIAACYLCDLPPTPGARRGVFFFARTIQGFGIGGIMCIIQTWLSEVMPTELRGPLMALFPIFKLLGQLVGALVCFSVIGSSSRTSYRICFATQWAFSGALTILVLFLPESPAWLLRKGKDDAARKAMVRLRGVKAGTHVESALQRLRDTISLEKDSGLEKGTYLDCFRRSQRRRTAIVCFAEFIPLLFGLQLLGSSSYFLQQIGMDAQTSVLFTVIGLVIGVVASCITFYTLSKFGRRTLTVPSLAAISLLWGGIGFSGIRQNTSGALWFTAVGMMLVIFCAGIGCWPATYAIASEASALRLRAKTQGIGWFSYGLGTMVFGVVMPYLYNPDAANLGSKSAFVYFAIAGIGAVVGYFLLPEMKGRSPQEIDTMFNLRLPARKFKHWSENEDGV